MERFNLTRRAFLKASVVSGAVIPVALRAIAQKGAGEGLSRWKTQFQIACMTLPYAQFSLERALSGIQSAGYEYVAWGTAHTQAEGKSVPIMPPDASPATAKQLSEHCRNLGLTPLMMFAAVYPDAPNATKLFMNHIEQAAAAGIPQVLTFGRTEGQDRDLCINRLKQLGPIARDNGVMIVLKQHGGDSGTGAACAEIIREVADDGIKVNYDAGNVMDYLNLDPIADIQKCATEVRSFCIKDHRNFPKDEDCGPGLGEIDHYKLLHAVAFTGLTMPLCCENVFAPLVPRPSDPAQVDVLARRAREFLELVISGLHA